MLGAIGFVSNTLFNPVKPTGKMGWDYSAIKSAYDLKINQVDHWCIQGDNDSCKCEDPLEAASRSEFKSWNSAHKANVAEVSKNAGQVLCGNDNLITLRSEGQHVQNAVRTTA